MSSFDYDGDGGNLPDFADDDLDLDDNNESTGAAPFDGPSDEPGPPGPMMNRIPRKHFRNDRYNNAFGDYRGGYGPGGGFGPPRPFFMGPPGPPPMWGRGFGPGGPPMRRGPMDDRAIKYLLRCGVAKEHLRNLPRDLLSMIGPEYCGLCAIALESYGTSRLHYISKNHLKNQKKWLNQNSQGLFHPNREQMPLKSRDLYCELCDVHITSKAHADTHYAGKPHRSIVEGRKYPRNPVLLQRGMERRLDQLIRREKKFLKAIDEAKGREAAPEVPGKAVPPELYCDICKTSVTCTEQMTMHMNGKKHLSREKQHILKMMKGETNEGKAEGAAEGNEGNEEGDNQNQGESGEQDFAWGQGEEKWDAEDQ